MSFNNNKLRSIPPSAALLLPPPGTPASGHAPSFGTRPIGRNSIILPVAMSGEGSSSRAQTVSEAALEKKKRAEAEQPYRPYVHDIGETGA